MDWIMYFIMFILGGIVMFMTICIGYAAKQEELANRVHFFVARDMDGRLFLYIGKPIRRREAFYADDKSVIIPFSSCYLKKLVLTKKISKALNGKMNLLRYS